MDVPNADTIVLLDVVQKELRVRWEDLSKKCKSLEESLNDVNTEREHLKIKLSFSQERTLQLEKEKNELALYLEEIRQNLEETNLFKIMNKFPNSSSASSYVSAFSSNTTISFACHTASDSTGIVPSVKNEDENSCSNAELTKQVAGQHTPAMEVDAQNDNNSNITGPNSEQFSETSSDIELVLSDDEPPTSEKVLTVNLKRFSFPNKAAVDVDVSFNSSDSHDQELSTCDICDKSFLFPVNFKNHMKQIHNVSPEESSSDESSDSDDSAETVKTCIVCDEIFAAKIDLDQHMKQVHPNEFRVVQQLDVDFRKKPKILPRLRSRSKEKSQISSDLPSSSKTNETIQKKRRVKSNLKMDKIKTAKQSSSKVVAKNSPSCDTVSKKLKMSSTEPTSDQLCDKKKLPWNSCNICNENFETGVKLNFHLKDRHADDRRILKCDYCDFVAQMFVSMKNHVKKRHLEIKK